MLIRRPAKRADEPLVCIQPRISQPKFRASVYKPRGAVAQLSGSTFIYVSGVSICDVGPRDGLQNEARTLEPSVRASLCDRLANAGLKKMEAASFVNPKLVPQMGGAEEVMSALHRKPGVVYAGLVLNEKGYDRARAALDAGAVSLDSSVGGAGGCPFAPKATGNIATEDLAYLLRGMGVDNGVDLDVLIACSQWLGEQLGKELPSMLARAGDYPPR